MKPKASDQLTPGTDSFYSRNFNRPVGNDSSWIDKIVCRSAALLVIFALIFIFLPYLEVTGQTAEALFDTVRFEENGRTGFDYQVSNSNTKTIGYHKSDFKKCHGDHFSIAGEVGREMLTLITGFGTDANKEVTWLLEGNIYSEDQNLQWKVDIYCPGSVSKSKERVRNEDGSFSTENFKEISINWDQSLGFIFHKGDTIGHFYVVIDPQFVPELDQWNKEILKMEIPGESAFLKGRRPFALWGDLWGQEILLIYNLGNNSMYLFNEMDLRGIFQPEQRKLLVSRKKIQKPLLLIKNTLDEQIKSDVLLFSMIGQWFMVSSHDPR